MPVIVLIIGLLLGIGAAFLCPGYIPKEFTTYVAVGILASLDSVIGGINAYKKRKFNLEIFVSGFFINAALAAFLTYVGSLLSIDLYLAAVVVFGARIFQNLAEIRRIILKKSHKDDRISL